MTILFFRAHSHWAKFQSTERRGFSILEVLVTVVLLSTAVLGPVALTTFTVSRASSSRHQLVAYNLAQEGIELIRGYRDTNVILGGGNVDAWDDDIGGAVPSTTHWRADIRCPSSPCTANAVRATPGYMQSCSLPFCSEYLFYDRAAGSPLGGFFYYESSAAEFTPYQRMVTIERGPQFDPSISANHQMRVASEVRWSERGQARSVQLTAILTAWRF